MDSKPNPDRPYKISSFYHKQAALEARFTQDEHGWMRAERFGDPEEEKRLAVEGVSLLDISHLGKVNLKGHDVIKILGKRYLSDRAPEPGKVLKPRPEALRDSICCILSHDEALFLTNSQNSEAISKHLSVNEPACFQLTDVSSVFAGLYLLGPRSRDVISRLTELNVTEEDFPNPSVAQTPLLHVQSIVIRHDLNDLLGFQIYSERAFAEYLWDAIIHAGKEFGLGVAGVASMTQLGWRWA